MASSYLFSDGDIILSVKASVSTYCVGVSLYLSRVITPHLLPGPLFSEDVNERKGLAWLVRNDEVSLFLLYIIEDRNHNL